MSDLGLLNRKEQFSLINIIPKNSLVRKALATVIFKKKFFMGFFPRSGIQRNSPNTYTEKYKLSGVPLKVHGYTF